MVDSWNCGCEDEWRASGIPFLGLQGDASLQALIPDRPSIEMRSIWSHARWRFLRWWPTIAYISVITSCRGWSIQRAGELLEEIRTGEPPRCNGPLRPLGAPTGIWVPNISFIFIHTYHYCSIQAKIANNFIYWLGGTVQYIWERHSAVTLVWAITLTTKSETWSLRSVFFHLIKSILWFMLQQELLNLE